MAITAEQAQTILDDFIKRKRDEQAQRLQRLQAAMLGSSPLNAAKLRTVIATEKARYDKDIKDATDSYSRKFGRAPTVASTAAAQARDAKTQADIEEGGPQARTAKNKQEQLADFNKSTAAKAGMGGAGALDVLAGGIVIPNYRPGETQPYSVTVRSPLDKGGQGEKRDVIAEEKQRKADLKALDKQIGDYFISGTTGKPATSASQVFDTGGITFNPDGTVDTKSNKTGYFLSGKLSPEAYSQLAERYQALKNAPTAGMSDDDLKAFQEKQNYKVGEFPIDFYRGVVGTQNKIVGPGSPEALKDVTLGDMAIRAETGRAYKDALREQELRKLVPDSPRLPRSEFDQFGGEITRGYTDPYNIIPRAPEGDRFQIGIGAGGEPEVKQTSEGVPLLEKFTRGRRIGEITPEPTPQDIADVQNKAVWEGRGTASREELLNRNLQAKAISDELYGQVTPKQVRDKMDILPDVAGIGRRVLPFQELRERAPVVANAIKDQQMSNIAEEVQQTPKEVELGLNNPGLQVLGNTLIPGLNLGSSGSLFTPGASLIRRALTPVEIAKSGYNLYTAPVPYPEYTRDELEQIAATGMPAP